MSTSNFTCEKVVFLIYILYLNISLFFESSKGNVFYPSEYIMVPMRRRMCTRALPVKHIGNLIFENNGSFAIGKLSLAFRRNDCSSRKSKGRRRIKDGRASLR